MAPAIKLADNGFVLKLGDVNLLNWGTEYFDKQPNVAAIFRIKGKPFKVGETAGAEKARRHPERDFRQGSRCLLQGRHRPARGRGRKANGGLLTMKDFADYTVAETKPFTCSYRGYQIISSPPPSSGGTIVCEIMNILSAYPMDKWTPIPQRACI